MPSSLYSISAPQITLEQGIASKKVEVKFAPDKVFTEFKKNGAEYVIALRLTSSVAKVRKSLSDFLYLPYRRIRLGWFGCAITGN
ncbi:MAG: DUF1735 domain-containing protein [Bacteroides xylanisolvens]